MDRVQALIREPASVRESVMVMVMVSVPGLESGLKAEADPKSAQEKV